MTLQYSTVLRTDEVSQIQTAVAAAGGQAILNIYAGTEPANCATALSGNTLLCTIDLPATFLTAANGATAIDGTWSGTGASAAGTGTTATFFRILDSAGTCHVQGAIPADMTLQNTSIASGQTVTITSFTVTAGNA